MAKTVLVIDDEDNIRECVTQALIMEGFAVLQAADGNEGVRLARKKKPDLILLDVQMDPIDGFQTLIILRKQTESANIPVLMLTGLSAVKDINQATELGANGYIIKPFDVERLFKKLDKVIALP